MGKRGYPFLLAAGETANGVDRLVDCRHPHEFVMEMSASVSQNLGPSRGRSAVLGAIRDFRVAENLAVVMGGLLSVNFIPAGLRDEYGGSNPHAAMAFLRLKVK